MRCDQCLFSPGKIVSDERRKELLAQCERQGKHFQCHKASITRQRICCRGFYDTWPAGVRALAEQLELVEFVPVPLIGKW